MKIVAASGYFDPLHVGHLDYLEMAKKLGDRLIVIVNNDRQARLKKGKPFMSAIDRLRIVNALSCVDVVVLSLDSVSSVSKTLEMIKPNIFANGGDRAVEEIPESKVCLRYGIEMIDGLGEKIRASSDFIKNNE